MDSNINFSNQKKTIVDFIGFGVFLYLSITSFGYLIRILIEKLLIINGISFEISFWIYSILYLVFILVPFYLAISYLKKASEINYPKIWVVLIATIILANIGQFIVAYYSTEYIEEKFPNQIAAYYDFSKPKGIYFTYEAVFSFLRYILIGTIVFIHKKQGK